MESKKTTELAVLDHTEFGIEKKEADKMVKNLTPILEERNVLEESYNRIMRMDIDDPEAAKQAREIRLKVSNNRTKGLMPWHKTNKEFYLRGGQFVDAIKNKEIVVNERWESELKDIENHAENKEIERKNKLAEERMEELEKYDMYNVAGLGEMDEHVYGGLLAGAKAQKEEKEKELMLDNLEENRKNKANVYRSFWIEGEDYDFRNMINSEFRKIIDGFKKEKKAQEEAAKAEQERKRAKELELAPDKEKLTILINTANLEWPTLENIDAKELLIELQSKFHGYKQWAIGEINKLK
jgi:hypothetical protein